jgi:hypothetical protein
VLPGARPEATVWVSVNRTIEQVVKPSSVAAGYVVFSEEDAQQFRDAVLLAHAVHPGGQFGRMTALILR